MNEIQSQLESILLVSNKSLSLTKLSAVLGVVEKEVQEAVQTLAHEYEERKSGIRLATNGKNVQLMTARDHSEIVQKFLRDEATGELTRPSLETLSIIAYRGPVSKTEIELIRGVNCSLILRNLLIRGLVDEKQDKNDIVPLYSVTIEFLKFLGMTNVARLPDYAKLNEHKSIDELLEKESGSEEE